MLLQRFLTLALLGIVTLTLVDFPVAKNWIALGLGAYVLLLWRFPSAWLLIIPTLLPVLDFTPWSGRIFFGEFDLLVLMTCAVGYWRKDPWINPLQFNRKTWFLILLLIAWQSYTTLNGLLPLQPIDANSFTSYYSQYNSLRIAKGFFFALMLLPLLGQAIGRGTSVVKLFSLGMLGGLATALMAIIWERALFAGIFNFDKPYRVTGFFSGMLTGGAPIDAHLALSLPFIAFIFLAWRNFVTQILGVIFLAIAIYGLAVTFSRADYLAVAFITVSFFGAWFYLRRQPNTEHSILGKHYYLITGLLIVSLIPVISGNYIQSRFATTASDFMHRIDHWQKTVGIMDNNWNTQLFGMGKGAFPRTYFWEYPTDTPPATVQHQTEGVNGFLRFGKSGSQGNLFLRQRFTILEEGPYHLSLDLRPLTKKPTRLLIEICERLIFQAYRECRWLGINTQSDPQQWVNFNNKLNINGLGESYWYGSRPVEISILNRGLGEGIDIDNIQISTPSGRQLLANGDFNSGLEHWVISFGDHLAWHIKNAWVDVFFESGIIGLLLFMTLSLTLLFNLIQRLKKRDQLPLLILPAFVGFLIIGLFDSLFDEPKLGILFFLLSWITLSNSITYPSLPQLQSHKTTYFHQLIKAYYHLPAPYQVTLGGLFAALVLSTLFVGATRHYELTSEQLIIRALEKSGITSGPITDLISPKIKYSDQSFAGTVRTTHPRILLPELSTWTGKAIPKFMQHRENLYAKQGTRPPASCGYGGVLGLASCWVNTGNHEAAEKLSQQLRTDYLTIPQPNGNYGNGWEFALAYDFLSLYPELSRMDQLEIEEKIQTALRHSLLLLDDDGMSLWHGRSTLSAIAWLCAIVLDQNNPEIQLLTKRAQGHFLETMKALALTEAWPEGYLYWVNDRGFLITLAASAYLNGIESSPEDANHIRTKCLGT